VKLSRIVIILLVVAAGLLFIFSVLRPSVPLPVAAELPIDLRTMIPDSWKVVPGQYKTCDFDSDGDNEYLIIYRYDTDTVFNRGLIGGVIYDTQVNRVPQAPGVEATYRPAFMVPYKLLPDIYGGKGQGYLGQNSVNVHLLPVSAAGAKCQAKEILVYGYSYDTGVPTILSVFRWEGELIGYVGWHVQGNVRLRAYDAASPDPSKPSATDNTGTAAVGVYVYNQLNQRSLLCSVRHYRRTPPTTKTDLPPGLDFREVTEDYTLDFCYGAPVDPAYPEGVVMALLRGQNPSAATPTGKSYLTTAALEALPPELNELRDPTRKAIRTLSVTAPGTLGWYPPPGSRFTWTPTGGTPPPTPQTWWLNSEPPTIVETEIVLASGASTRQARWTLVSMANEKANADTIWRISRVELR